jgi:ABC-type nitrate/sulfonate/bicarbonate transport system substrate-binding protein
MAGKLGLLPRPLVRGLAGGVLLALIVATGCQPAASTGGQASATRAPANRQATAPTPLRKLGVGVGGGVNSASLPVLYAAEAGFFQRRGLDAEFQVLSNDTLGAQGLLAREYQVLFTGATPTMIAVASGTRVKIISSPSPRLDYYFVVQRDVRDFKDMEGRNLGVSAPGAQSAIIPRTMLKNHGADVDRVNVVGIGTDSARGQALIGKTIDGAVLNTMVTVATTRQAPELHVIGDAGAELFEDFFANAIIARTETLQSDPDLLQSAVASVIESSRALQSDRARFVAYAKSQPGLPSDAVEAAHELLTKSGQPYYGVDGGLNRRAFDATVQSLLDSGQLKTPITWEQLVEPRFVDGAMAELGPYQRS